MQSKWFPLKGRAINLRKKGYSIRKIENKLGIPKSTLSGWFTDVILTSEQKSKLQTDWLKGLIKARSKAVIWHNQQKASRLKIAKEEAIKILSKIDITDDSILELALAMLYLGEGFKTKSGLGICNSDPLILKFFIKMLVSYYHIEVSKIKCSLHLRADQDPEKLKKFWSKELNLPVANFTSPSIDLRTIGRVTYNTYNGVCVVQCGNIAVQRKLLFLSRKFCQYISRE